MNFTEKKRYMRPSMDVHPLDVSISLLNESSPPPPPPPMGFGQDNRDSPFRESIFPDNPLDGWNK